MKQATKAFDGEDNEQILPDQKAFFDTQKLKRSARAGTQLPNPNIMPFGYDPKEHFGHIFPKIHLPILLPPPRIHPEDYASFGNPDADPTKLFFGDNLYVLRNLPSESVDLIYIDPPFFSNRDYVQIWGDDNEVRSFGDIFGDGMFSYLAWLNARLWEMKRILKPTGSIYVHCDWHASHYIKCEMDKIFGYENMVNDIVWQATGSHNNPAQYGRNSAHILFYIKGSSKTWNIPRLGKTESYINKYFKKDKDGRYFRLNNPTGAGYNSRTVDFGKGQVLPPAGRHWSVKQEMIDQWISEGRIVFTVSGYPMVKKYLDELEGPIAQEMWTDLIPPRSSDYPTQKPEVLLERIIKASSNEGDVVADFFMGGGTTGAVALRLGRKFIGSDVSRVAVSVTQNRLIEVCENMSGTQKQSAEEVGVARKDKKTGYDMLFISGTNLRIPDIRVGYVGSYPKDRFRGMEQDEFVKFLVKLYGASVFTGEAKHIHGVANGKIILHIGPAHPQEAVTVEQVKSFVEEVITSFSSQLAAGQSRELQIIGWEFDPRITEWKRQAVRALNIKGLKITIELVSLSSEAFRKRVFKSVGESNMDLSMNRLNQLLSFTDKPYIGSIVVRKTKGLEVDFELIGAKALGAGAKLINCQWDFDFEDDRFSDKKYALNRTKGKGNVYEAVFTVKHTFDRYGDHLIAARVQDSVDGEAMLVVTLRLNEKGAEIIAQK